MSVTHKDIHRSCEEVSGRKIAWWKCLHGNFHFRNQGLGTPVCPLLTILSTEAVGKNAAQNLGRYWLLLQIKDLHQLPWPCSQYCPQNLCRRGQNRRGRSGENFLRTARKSLWIKDFTPKTWPCSQSYQQIMCRSAQRGNTPHLPVRIFCAWE